MDLDKIAERIGMPESYRILGMDVHKIEFIYVENNNPYRKIELGFGYQDVMHKFFKKKVPGEAEIEYAINFIEDNLMSNDKLVNTDDELYIDQKSVSDLLNTFQVENKKVSREEIEEIFTRYAFVSMSRLPVYGDDQMDNEKYARTLILREIMHHLNFTSINVAD